MIDSIKKFTFNVNTLMITNFQQHHPQQYFIVRPQIQNQALPNLVSVHREQQSQKHGEQVQVAHVIEPQHQQVPHIEVQDSQSSTQTVGVQFVPENVQYNPQQIYAQHPHIGAQHILLHPVPQYVPQYNQSPQQQQPKPQQSQQAQFVQHKPMINVPIVRVGQAIQQQHPQIFNQGDVGHQQHVIQHIPNSYTQQSVPSVINQQHVSQQSVQHLATLPEGSGAEQPHQYYSQVQPEPQHADPHKDQQQAHVVSHIIVPISGQHPSAVGVYTEAQGVPSHVQVIGQHYQQNAVQQGVSYPNSDQYVVNQQSNMLAYPVNTVRGVDIATHSQEVEHAISAPQPQTHVPSSPTSDVQYVTQAANVVIPYNPNTVAPHHPQGIQSSADQYVPLQSHQYIPSPQPEQQKQLHHHQQQQQQPLQQSISHLHSQSSSPSSQQTGTHNGAIKPQGI